MKVRDCSRLLVTAAALAVGGCASSPPPSDTFQANVVQAGVPGSVTVEIATTKATVTAVDHATREVSLEQTDGTKVTFIAGPEVKNFDQVKVGDHVKATVTNRLEIFVRPGGGEPSAQAPSTTTATAARGSKPGMVTTTTGQITAKILALDTTARTATVQYPDGKTETFPVRSDIDMSKVKVGEEVVMRGTEIRSLIVEAAP